MRRRKGEGTIYKRKDGRFEVSVFIQTPNGSKRVRRYLHTRMEADALLVELRGRSQNGLLTDNSQRRLGEFLDYWLEVAKPKLRRGTYTSYETTVRIYLKPGLGKKYLTKLSVADVQSYLDGQLKVGKSHRTIQKIKLVLSTALKRAEHEELLVRNVARLVDIPQYRPKEVVPWNMNQLRMFLDQATNEPFYPIFLLLSMYGLRTSEALGLSWSDIDFSNGVIRIRQQMQYYDDSYHYTDLKTHAGRRDLPLIDIAYTVLGNIERSNIGPLPDLVFKTKTGIPIDSGNLRRSFKRISSDAGLPILTLHHLRHTAATMLKNIGVAAKDTQLILGHAHITTTLQIYQHGDIEMRYKALDLYEQRLAEVSGYSRQNKPSVA